MLIWKTLKKLFAMYSRLKFNYIEALSCPLLEICVLDTKDLKMSYKERLKALKMPSMVHKDKKKATVITTNKVIKGLKLQKIS